MSFCRFQKPPRFLGAVGPNLGMFDFGEVHQERHVPRYQIELACAIQSHSKNHEAVANGRSGKTPRRGRRLAIDGPLDAWATLYDGLKLPILRSLDVLWGKLR